MEALQLRAAIYRHFVAAGTAPSRAELIGIVGDPGTADVLLQQLHDAHMIVLDTRPHRRGEIRMALPFAAEPTAYRVTTEQGRWWANCAWDSLAIIAALGTDGHVDAIWSDTGEPLSLAVVDGELGAPDGYIHVTIPAHRWWDDIVLT